MTLVLKVDTKASLHEPLEVEIDGRILKVKEVTLGGLEEIQSLTPDLLGGSAAAVKKILSLLLEGENDELFALLPLSRLKPLVETLVARSVNPTEEEKNGQRPGDESSS